MTTAEALYALGVRENTLSRQEKEQLDQEGYLLLTNILSAQQVADFRTRIDELLEVEGSGTREEEPGAERLNKLEDRGVLFDVCFTHPRILAAVAHVLGEVKLTLLVYRAALPGFGLQGLHVDDLLSPEGHFTACNTIWLLDDFSPENGPTRLVPGTHRSGELPENVLADRDAPHPQEITLLAPAGTVCIFNSHTWHGGYAELNRAAPARHDSLLLSPRSPARS